MLCSIFERSTRLVASLKSLSLFYSKRLFSRPEGECRPEEGRATKWPGRRGVRGAIAGCCLALIPSLALSADIVTTKITATNTAFKNMSTQNGKFHGVGTGTFTGNVFGNFSGGSSGTHTGSFTGKVNGTYVITSFTNLSSAKASIGSTKATLEISTNQSVNTLTLPSTLTIKPINGAIITIASGKILTINGPLIDPSAQCFAGSGAVIGLKEARPEWFDSSVTSAAIQSAINSLVSGGALDTTKVTGTITLTSQIAVNKPCVIKLGNTAYTSNIAPAQWLVTSSGVSFIGISPALSKLTSTYDLGALSSAALSSDGNIIQWGVTGAAHTYTDLTVQKIQFTNPVVTGAIDYYRNTMSAIVALAETINTLTPNTGITIEDNVFNEGANQISLEQVNKGIISRNTFNTSKGRALLQWNSDKLNVTHNTHNDPSGTSVNFNEGFFSAALNKGNDDNIYANNIIDGTRYEALKLTGNRSIAHHNILKNVKGVGIAVGGAGTSANIVIGTMVDHNEIDCQGGGVGGAGISIFGGATYGPQQTIVDANHIKMRSSGQQAILISGVGTDGVDLKNNIAEASGLGAGIAGLQANDSNNIRMTNNNITGFTLHALYFNTANNIHVVGNIGKNNTSNGLRISPGSANNFVGFVSDNYFEGGTYGILLDTGIYRSLLIPNTNRYYGTGTALSNNAYTYLGDQTRIDGAVIPASGYMNAGEIVYRGSGQAGGASSGWVCTTAGYLLKGAWTTGTAYITGYMVSNGGNIYQATNSGTSGATAPTHSSGDVSDGTVTWRFIAVGSAAVVKTLPAVGA